MAEIFFFGTLLVIFRFHDQYTGEMQKILHLNAVVSVFAALILAVILGAVGGAIGGAFHRMDAIRGVDGLLGVFVHVLVTVVIVYLGVSALVTLDNAFVPIVNKASLTLTQVNQLESMILSNPITAAMVSKDDLNALKAAAAKNDAAHIESIGGIHQLEQLYTGFLEPQLHSSRTVPFILGFGQLVPGRATSRAGPVSDLRPGAAGRSRPRLLQPRVCAADRRRRSRRTSRPRDLRQAGLARPPRRVLPAALWRSRARLPRPWPGLRGARVRRHRLPHRAVGPCRPGRDGPVHLGNRGAEAAVAGTDGTGREARLLRLDRAQRGI